MTARQRIKLRKGHRALYQMLFALLGTTVLLSEGGSIGSKADDRAIENMTHNLKLVTDPEGRKTLVVRWAIGSRDHVETLRIPASYVDPIMLIGCATFDGKSAEECSLPYAVRLDLKAKLPDLEPLQQQPHTEEEDRPTAYIFIQSVLWGSKNLTEAEMQQIFAETAFEFLNFGPIASKFKVVRKADKFGLRRIGLDHNANPDIATSFKEIFFNGDDPATSSDFAVCSDEAVPTRLQDPKSPGAPLCEQYFTVPALSATVKVRYERQHLEDWRAIKAKTLSLIISFKN